MAGHAALMDGVYRRQRHFYDLTRKYYLLGRDRLIDELGVQAGGMVLELGCGTGRNLLLAADRYRDARFFGLDISLAMLETAQGRIARSGHQGRISLSAGDAASFDCAALFGVPAVDHVFISYALSMIPPWREAIEAGIGCLAPGGTLHIVDFGQQADLPRFFHAGLHAWLARFHVMPRRDLVEVTRQTAARRGASLTFRPLYRDYAWYLKVAA